MNSARLYLLHSRFGSGSLIGSLVYIIGIIIIIIIIIITIIIIIIII